MQGRSLLKLLPKRLQCTIINEEQRSNAPSSHPLADNTCEKDIPDTPPPTYEEACSGPNRDSIGTVTGTQRPQDPRALRIINETISKVNHELEQAKQLDGTIDVVYISSRIRQLCEFAACRIAVDLQRHPYACFVVRRQKTLHEVERLFKSVFATVDWERQDGTKVVCITAWAFWESSNQILGEYEHRTYYQARSGFCSMSSVVCKTAGQILERLDEEKERVRLFAESADKSARAAKACISVVKFDILGRLLGFT